jgi:RHS repeat-associated protein
MWQPISSHASSGDNPLPLTTQAAVNVSDDFAACSDAPAPTLDGENPGFAGKPVNLNSGVETMTRSDISTGSLYPVTITRRYDSRTTYDSPVGFGWALNYDRRIYTYPDGSVTLRKECGWKKRYTLSGGSFITPLGETGTLVKNADNSYTFTYNSGDKDLYDSQGRLIGMVDPIGNSVAITYELDTRSALWGLLPTNIDQSNALIVAYDYRLSRIEEKDSSGALTNHWVLFHYDTTTGRLTDIVDNAGRTVTFGHDNIGNLTSVTGPAGNMVYGYIDAANKHKITSIDEGQGIYANTYDAQGRVLQQTHGTGSIAFEYQSPYKKTKITTTVKDGAGNVLNTQTRTTEFDTNGQVAKTTDTYGNVMNYTRNSSMYVTREEHWENTGTVSSPTLTFRRANEYTYDDKGNMLTKTLAQGSPAAITTTYTYHPTFNRVATETVASVVNTSQNRVRTNSYNPATGRLETVTETGYLGNGAPYTYVTTYAYNANGRLQSIDGPRTDVPDVTTYTYDPVTAYLTSITQPLVGTTTYSNHDAHGNPRTVRDPNENSTLYTYDDSGNVLTVKAPGDANPTQYFYVINTCPDCSGGQSRLDHVILPEGQRIDLGYDNQGNLGMIKDSSSNTINYASDSEGNRLSTQIKDSAGTLQRSVSYQYDQKNRLTSVASAGSSVQYSYDSRNNVTSVKDPKNNTTTAQYDELGRIKTVSQPGALTTSAGYNTNNRLTSITDANNTATQYTHGDDEKVSQVVSPDTRTATYQYDPAGNMTGKTDANGVTINYTYDALNRLTKIDFPTDTDITYTYDTCVNGKGWLCSMTDASGTTSYEYTPKGQVKKETKVIDTHTYVTQYTYDQNGNMKTMTYPSGKVITYNYTHNKVSSVQNNAAYLALNIEYRPFTGSSSFMYGNGIPATIAKDNQYRIMSIVTGTAMNLSYSLYDDNGNIRTITDNVDPAKNKAFTYDALDRLATAAGPFGNITWTYDGVGNRQTENGNTYAYFSNTNRLASVNGTVFGYDNNGNTTSNGLWLYTYNQNQRMIQADDGTTVAHYTYNGSGQRVKKNVSGTLTIFHYSLSGQLIAESDNAGTITAEYVYLNGEPLAKMEGANTYYYHNDHLGTPQKMTDSSGQVVWAADYKPFGEATITVSTITNNLRFPGQYYDAETGLNYNYFRDYNPVIGRYVEKDPIGQRGGFNLYRYVGNNPNNRKDPYGLDPDLRDVITTFIQEALTSVIENILPSAVRVPFKVGGAALNVLDPFPPDLNAGEEHDALMRENAELNAIYDRLVNELPATKDALDKLIKDEEKRTGNCYH